MNPTEKISFHGRFPMYACATETSIFPRLQVISSQPRGPAATRILEGGGGQLISHMPLA